MQNSCKENCPLLKSASAGLYPSSGITSAFPGIMQLHEERSVRFWQDLCQRAEKCGGPIAEVTLFRREKWEITLMDIYRRIFGPKKSSDPEMFIRPTYRCALVDNQEKV